jgi:hypothetical protein
MVIVPVAVVEVPFESTTLKVMLAAEPLTAAVGVPVIAPVLVFRVKPAGNLPELSENVYGDFPPVAASESVNAVPTVPVALGNVRVKGAVVVRVTVAVCVIPLPEAVTVIG